MDEIRADKPGRPDDRIQDRPTEDGEVPFRQTDSKPPMSESVAVRSWVIRFLVYSLVVGGCVALSSPRCDKPLFLAICCWGGAITIGIIGWFITVKGIKSARPTLWGSAAEDNPFKKREARWSVVVVGIVAALIWAFVLFGLAFRLFYG